MELKSLKRQDTSRGRGILMASLCGYILFSIVLLFGALSQGTDILKVMIQLPSGNKFAELFYHLAFGRTYGLLFGKEDGGLFLGQLGVLLSLFGGVGAMGLLWRRSRRRSL